MVSIETEQIDKQYVYIFWWLRVCSLLIYAGHVQYVEWM